MKNAPIIYGSMDTALQNDVVEALELSITTNISCRDFIEQKLEERKKTILDLVIEEYGTDRTQVILATSVQAAEQSEDITPENKVWAIDTTLPEEQWCDYLLTDTKALNDMVEQFRYYATQESLATLKPIEKKEGITLMERLAEHKKKINQSTQNQQEGGEN